MSALDSSSIPPGYCHCGCGAKTTIARRNNTTYGHVKGQPVRFAPGHNRRTSPHDYVEEDQGYETSCWIWQRWKNELGYGKRRIKGRTLWVHRLYYEKYKGAIPEGLDLDHLCRNTSCVNPEHLEPVTHAQNMRRGKGTKLTPDDVRSIRQLAKEGLSYREISDRYNLFYKYVGLIVRRQAWKDLS